tara:strand:+ start:108 stop:845 length:738 start_codon:yes stop_codon:yes gene_type:complete
MIKYDICMATWNRPKSLQMTIDSLFESDLSLCDRIYVYDDCSFNKENIDILNELKKKDKVTLYTQPTHIGVHENATMCILSSDKNYVVIIGDDTLFNKEWLNKLDWLRKKAENRGEWGCLTVANFPNQSIIKTIERDFVQKKEIGSFSTMYRMDIMREHNTELETTTSFKVWPVGVREDGQLIAMDKMHIMYDDAYDWLYQKECAKRGLPMYSTVNSYSYHLDYPCKKALHPHNQVVNFVGNGNL